MAKYVKRRLSPQLRRELLLTFAQALTIIRDESEAVAFIADLLSRQEAEMLAKRLMIADRLMSGERYSDIQKALKVSAPTIARVNAWLGSSGEGYRMIRDRKRPLTEPVPRQRRRATIYNWPEVLLDEILASSSRRQRERVERLVQALDEKSELYQELEPLLRRATRSYAAQDRSRRK